MFAKPPKAEEMAMFGLTLESATVQAEVWPDDVETVNTFLAMDTQWRMVGSDATGHLIATGMDYAALPVVLRLRSIPRRDHAYIFDGLRIMEQQALEELAARREEAAKEAEVRRRMSNGR